MKLNCLFIIITLIGCTTKFEEQSSDAKNVYHVEHFDDQFFNWDGLVDTVETIRLETSPNALLGTISKAIVENNHILIQDLRTQKVLMFNMKSQFIRETGIKGRWPAVYEYISESDGSATGKTYLRNSSGAIVKECTTNYEFKRIDCLGNGTLSCTPSIVRTRILSYGCTPV